MEILGEIHAQTVDIKPNENGLGREEGGCKRSHVVTSAVE